MKHPDKWRETIDPFSLPYKHFKPLEILGYPHAGNDVFHVKGLVNGKETYAFVKVARQKGADIANEVYVLSQFQLDTSPKIIDYCLDETPFIVTEEINGERLSTIVGENKELESLSYLEEYGETLAKIHQMNIKATPVKDRRFFHKPSKELLQSLKLEELEDCFSLNIADENYCFVHGDFHYANILWDEHHISGILDYELSGIGNKEFDIAWALFRRPGQQFMLAEEEVQLFLKGYSKYGTYNEQNVITYMAQCYVYFLDMCKMDDEYCTYIRDWLKQFVLNNNVNTKIS